MSEERSFLKVVGIVLALCFTIAIVATMAFSNAAKRDDTDSLHGPRSDMLLLTDYGTGCQYLSRGVSLTPRLDKDGQPYCRAELRSRWSDAKP